MDSSLQDSADHDDRLYPTHSSACSSVGRRELFPDKVLNNTQGPVRESSRIGLPGTTDTLLTRRIWKVVSGPWPTGTAPAAEIALSPTALENVRNSYKEVPSMACLVME
jgi:hypothetical protein